MKNEDDEFLEYAEKIVNKKFSTNDLMLNVYKIFQSNPLKPITYKYLSNKLVKYLYHYSDMSNSLKAIRVAVAKLKTYGVDIRKYKNTSKMIYYPLPDEVEMSKKILFNILKSNSISSFTLKNSSFFDRFNYNNALQNTIINDELCLEDKNNINIDKFYTINSAINENKYITFNNNINNLNVEYIPLAFTFKDNICYLFVLYQVRPRAHYVLDYYDISTINDVKVNTYYEFKKDEVYQRVVPKLFPYYKEFYPDLFKNGSKEALLSLLGNNPFHKKCYEIKFRDSSYKDEINSKFEYVDFYTEKTEDSLYYYAYIYEDNKYKVFEWMYSKKSLLEDLRDEKKELKEYIYDLKNDFKDNTISIEKANKSIEKISKQERQGFIQFENNGILNEYLDYVYSKYN